VGGRLEADVPKPKPPNFVVILTDERSWVGTPLQIDLEDDGPGAFVPNGRVGHR
jgi:hypothetical protein